MTGSLIAFVIVYFAVFARGHALHPAADGARRRSRGETGAEPTAPIRSAGITPAPAIARGASGGWTEAAA